MNGDEIVKRNFSIELLKLYFAISVALGHAHLGSTLPIISGGYAVLLFFVLSGYFLVNSFNSNKYPSAWHYSYARLKRIYPYYLFSFIVLFLYKNLQHTNNFCTTFKDFLTSLPEIFLLQNIGVFSGGINYPLWQLCTLIVVSHVLFALLICNKEATLNVICPLLSLSVFTYLSNAYGTGTPDSWGVECEFIYVPLVRAAGSISLGMFLNYPIKKMLKFLDSSTFSHLPLLMSVASIPLFVTFWLNRNNYTIVIPFSLILVCMFYSKGFFSKFFQKAIFSKLDKLSLAIYLNHAFIIHLFQYHANIYSGLSSLATDLLYLAILIMYSIIALLAVDLLKAITNRLLIYISK